MMIEFPVAILGGSIGSGEFLVILLIAFVIFGPARLPVIARNIGRFLEKLRQSAREFSDAFTRASLDDAADEPVAKRQNKSASRDGDSTSAP